MYEFDSGSVQEAASRIAYHDAARRKRRMPYSEATWWNVHLTGADRQEYVRLALEVAQTVRRVRPDYRGVEVNAYGDTMAEIEAMALQEARPVFGGDADLEVVPDYIARKPLTGSSRRRADELGVRLHATVTVRRS